MRCGATQEIACRLFIYAISRATRRISVFTENTHLQMR